MFQTIIVVGNLGRDPEMRYTPAGKPVTNFSVATNRTWTDAQGQQVKETVWFKVAVWGAMAESCNQYLKKGSKVLVEGRLTADPATGGPRVWAGQDGSMRASFEISASNVRFLTPKTDGGPEPLDPGFETHGDGEPVAPAPEPTVSDAQAPAPIPDSDIPF